MARDDELAKARTEAYIDAFDVILAMLDTDSPLRSELVAYKEKLMSIPLWIDSVIRFDAPPHPTT